MEAGHGDWGGDDESDHPSNKPTTAILGWEPLELAQGSDCNSNSGETTEDGSGDEAGFPRCVAKNRADDGTETCKEPGKQESREGLH